MTLYRESPTLLIERGEVHTVNIWGKLYAWHTDGKRLWVERYFPPEQRTFKHRREDRGIRSPWGNNLGKDQ